jgi:DNA polymerase
MSWAKHHEKWNACTRCELHESRLKVVLGMGRIPHGVHPGAPFFVAGKHPGEDEDKIGLPMQGPAGHWVKWALTGPLGASYDDCFFANVLGCKPPGNPRVKWIETCTPRVDELLELVQPKMIIAMGLVAAKFFLEDKKIKMGDVAGSRHVYRGIHVAPVIHPAEPPRQKTASGKRESERKVIANFRSVRDWCIELGLIERLIE